jgi:ribosome biogenesis protein ENP2
MALKATSAFNDVKVYNCTGGRTLPEWYEDFRKKKVTSLRYNTDFRNRIDLLQDFEFPSASTCISMSKDKRYIGATGTYKPQIKVFDTQQLGLKFERHLDAEAVKFQFLAEDFTKILVMRNDRVVEIHASYGRHHQVRLPKFGRDMCYDDTSCDAVLVGQGNEAWRLNLEEGRFMSPLVTDLPSINKVASNPMHQLLAFGGEDGQLEFWDPRDRTRAGKLDLVKTAGAINKALSAKLSAKGCDVTSVAYDEDGLGLAVGTSSGHVLLYDLRNNAPTIWKDHRYLSPSLLPAVLQYLMYTLHSGTACPS